VRLIDDAHRDDPALDMALTGALLEGVADGSVEETVRVFRPGPTVALGRMDRVRPGFARRVRLRSSMGGSRCCAGVGDTLRRTARIA